MKKTIILLFLTFSLFAQAQKTEVGVIAGVSLYSGDISPKEFGLFFQELQPAFGIFGRINPSRTFSARLSLSYTKLMADDFEVGIPERGLNFRTNLFEGELMGEINIFRWGDSRRVEVVPFLTGGVGFFRFNPQGRLEDTWVDLQPLGTEGQGLPDYEAPYELTQLNIPAGGGVKFIFNEQWTLGLEFTGRKLFTDHLDDISNASVYYLDVLEGNGQLAAQFSNPNVKSPEEGDFTYTRGGQYMDWYFFGNITLSFNIGRLSGVAGGRGIGCPNNDF
ncbi:MAG: hypothetical protein DWQ02_13990 [Bacteroidetes bacterium]|nr:MAG: hypothetical protein DWQ02_13990 [Bacteroidota bacterium]